MDYKVLLEKAFLAREMAYAPYSGFKVGAAILSGGGEIYTGCNIENASYGLSICAERTALFNAVSKGHKDFTAIAIAASEGVSPCGACRQVLVEFSPEADVITPNQEGSLDIIKVRELLPAAFSLKKDQG